MSGLEAPPFRPEEEIPPFRPQETTNMLKVTVKAIAYSIFHLVVVFTSLEVSDSTGSSRLSLIHIVAMVAPTVFFLTFF
jgi:hypothetical protein